VQSPLVKGIPPAQFDCVKLPVAADQLASGVNKKRKNRIKGGKGFATSTFRLLFNGSAML